MRGTCHKSILHVLAYTLYHHTGITKNGHVQPTNQPAPRVTPPPVEWKCDIKTMYMCGVKKLAPYWITVADFLDYSVAEKEKFRCDDNKSSLVAVLEDWITTDNGREPKTWSTFAKVLTEVDEDQSISLGHEIYVKLQSKGVLILPNTSKILFCMLSAHMITMVKHISFSEIDLN